MSVLRYVTHADVVIEPGTPVARWGMSDRGFERVQAMLGRPWVATIGRIVSSDERKAVETATMLADHLGLAVEVRPDTGENDRTATGFVPPHEFEGLADAFFAEPGRSVRGWERAVDAQRRIVAALADLLDPDAGATPPGDTDAGDPPVGDIALGDIAVGDIALGDTAVIGHGAVGTLWYCHLAGLPIDRRHDQPGQGHYFTVDRTDGTVLHPWRPIDGPRP